MDGAGAVAGAPPILDGGEQAADTKQTSVAVSRRRLFGIPLKQFG